MQLRSPGLQPRAFPSPMGWEWPLAPALRPLPLASRIPCYKTSQKTDREPERSKFQCKRQIFNATTRRSFSFARAIDSKTLFYAILPRLDIGIEHAPSLHRHQEKELLYMVGGDTLNAGFCRCSLLQYEFEAAYCKARLLYSGVRAGCRIRSGAG